MDEIEALTEASPKASRRAASAPEAAAWIDHPDKPTKRTSPAERLANEPEWKGEPCQNQS
jgi:hypothetical protein